MAALGRAITFPGQQFGNLGVINTLARQVEQAGHHLGATGQVLQPIYRLLDHEVADLPTAPPGARSCTPFPACSTTRSLPPPPPQTMRTLMRSGAARRSTTLSIRQ